MTTIINVSNRDGLVIPGAHFTRTDDDDIAKDRLHWPSLQALKRTITAVRTGVEDVNTYSKNDLLFEWEQRTLARETDAVDPRRICLVNGMRQFGTINGNVGLQGTVTTLTGVGANQVANLGITPLSTDVQSTLINAGVTNEIGLIGYYLASTADTGSILSLVARSAADDTEHIRFQFNQTATASVQRRAASTDTQEAALSGVTAPGNWVVLGLRLTGTSAVPVINGRVFPAITLSGAAQAFTGTRVGFRWHGGTQPNARLLMFEAFRL